MMKKTVLAATVVLALGATWHVTAQQPAPRAGGPAGRGGPPGGGPENGMNVRPPNGQGQTPAFAGQTRAPEQKLNVPFTVVTVTEGLVNPWGLAFLPDGRMLVTERPGRLRVISADGKQLSEPVTGLPAVEANGQGGLLGIALDPAFQTNRLIYWSYAQPGENGNNTAVARGRLVDGAPPMVENAQVIFKQAPSLASRAHFGGRLVFGRDGTLFITLGDRSITEGRMQSQKMDSLIGKIARVNADGSIPRDNPFAGKEGVRPEIWSYGHRNIQAAALHPTTGELWEVEHGTRGGDELNIARKGLDYGWPTIAYGIEYAGPPITGGITQREGMEQPVYFWDPNIAPSGMTFYTGALFPAWQNSLFVGGLASTNLVRLSVQGERIVGEERLLQDLQPQRERIRDVRQGPDGALYLLIDSLQGRLIKLVPRPSLARGRGAAAEVGAPARPPGVKNYITPGGWQRLQDERRFLLTRERRAVTEVVAWAASNGDRSENADYQYGKKRLREIDRRIRFLTKRIDAAEIVDPEAPRSGRAATQVFFGATVRYANATGTERVVSIVGVDEVDLDRGHISWMSPLARALMKSGPGARVVLRAPGTTEQLEILEVRYARIDVARFTEPPGAQSAPKGGTHSGG